MVRCRCPKPPARMGMEIEADALPQPPPPEPGPGIHPKILAILRKYEYNWRESELAKPKMPRRKYVPPRYSIPVAKGLPAMTVDTECLERCEHLARPKLIVVQSNRNFYKDRQSDPHAYYLERTEVKAWNAVYNFYRRHDKEVLDIKAKRERAKRLKEITAKKLLRAKESVERTKKLAKPKKLHPPPPLPPRKAKPIGKFIRTFAELQQPKVRLDPIENMVPFTSPNALKYRATPRTTLLAEQPKRYELIEPSVKIGYISPEALAFVMTPRLKRLAKPRLRVEKETEATNDAWTISPFALKYKATPRILDLAKPKERK